MRARKKYGFPGGIHPTCGEDKQLSDHQPIVEYQPDFVKISMKQSPFGSCKVLVEQGEWVEAGQLIGRPEIPLVVNLHASVSGTIKKIEETGTGEKDSVQICEIETDHSWQKKRRILDYEKECLEMRVYSKEEILTAIQDKGICGMGGAGFPTYLKYQTDKPVHTVLINGAECEPYLTCDDRLMQEEPYAVLCGMRLLGMAAGAKQVILCIEDHKQEAIAQFRNIISPAYGELPLAKLPSRYPQGGEKQLIQAVLGLEVPFGKLTADIGVLVSNVATAKACADAVLGQTALTHRVVTVSGNVEQPGNYRVPIGTPIEELLKLSGGVKGRDNLLILGGPMTGQQLTSVYYKGMPLPGVTKTTSAVLALAAEQYRESPCIRCGACGQVCPAGLIPYQIEFAYLEGDFAWCEKLYAQSCIACGCCSYVCLARRPLAARIQEAAGAIRQRKAAGGEG